MIHAVLDKSNFSNYVSQHSDKPIIAMLHMNWCGHCKHAHPFFNEMQNYFADFEELITTDVECEANREVCSQFSISGYPSYFILYQGKKTNKFCKANYDYMVNYGYEVMEEVYGSNLTQIKDEKYKIDKIPYIEFLEEPNNLTLLNYARYLLRKPEFKTLNAYYRNSTEAGPNGTLIYHFSSTNSIKCKDPLTFQNVINFLLKFTSDIREEWDFKSILESQKLFSIYIPRTSMDNLFYRKCANHFSRISTFGHSKSVGTKIVASKFGLSNKELPAIVVFDPNTKKFAKFAKSSNITELEQFYQSITDGKANEENYNLDDSIFDVISQSNLAIISLSLSIGIIIVGVLFYTYNCALGNLKKMD
ncbi:hypothetical protein TVAG_414880 [Trichomonas vaginalis G3]|uniref:Thioredoxin domain-containing protein n=1 Tax=Trichomonas vaginalis (strain ATCC PRA-98 / G3) TaxID=412133 RepID=A2G2P8_TRIV3|nr:disulfide-isomerase C17h9.14C-related family [Trichomonas vaginalis G3]EAX88571.1 hypothetical protein TVAG_414880 [Trichomonas vaginalis G3]KAI5535324.1 disulfide-isomerase C17h9.14C-related family [Trichomonas vaginalis G3]|eukprot:XP_001301501.1 hypothetical protein [Trichomonas vaginalis G3]